jgi:DNA-directed RNA polymerase specialized sigma24 family protein
LPEESVADLVGRIGVSTSVGLKDVIALIRQALDPVEFEIIRLKILDELSYGDIAGLFGTTPEAVRKRYVRSLLKVRKTIADPFASSGLARG